MNGVWTGFHRFAAYLIALGAGALGMRVGLALNAVLDVLASGHLERLDFPNPFAGAHVLATLLIFAGVAAIPALIGAIIVVQRRWLTCWQFIVVGACAAMSCIVLVCIAAGAKLFLPILRTYFPIFGPPVAFAGAVGAVAAWLYLRLVGEIVRQTGPGTLVP